MNDRKDKTFMRFYYNVKDNFVCIISNKWKREFLRKYNKFLIG